MNMRNAESVLFTSGRQLAGLAPLWAGLAVTYRGCVPREGGALVAAARVWWRRRSSRRRLRHQ